MGLGIYTHFPWCVRKCPYCDFNSHPLHSELDETGYVSRLIDDLNSETDSTEQSINTIYLGGGTPSLFSADALARFLEAVDRKHVSEITMEANPGTLEHEAFEAYSDAGITRISIGVQSFDPEQLIKIGRIHSADDASRAVENALNAGFENVNLDLMFGLPDQTLEGAMDDLERAISFGTDHLSWYQLTIEPRTEFHRRPPKLASDDLRAEMSDIGRRLLEENGYSQYEVSAFGRDGSRCRHNLNYWRFGDYVGIGAGAHGKTWLDGKVVRTMRPRQPRLYLSGAPAEIVTVERDELPVEFMMNALRLTEGVETPLFSQTTGLPYEIISDVVDRLVSWELMKPGRLQATDRGYSQLNAVVGQFLN
ncbi:MAG: radical SAM family heme chaperone HemW [Pseudomonadales bacterium]